MTRKSARKIRTGMVVSDKADKTIAVAIETSYRHPLYRKTLKKTKKFAVHDEENKARVGDQVRIMEIRPISKTKHWRLLDVVKEAE